MTTEMGRQIIDALQKKLGASTPLTLARELGITYQAMQNWKRRKDVTPRQIASLVDKARQAASRSAEVRSIRPIVEFFPVKKAHTKQNAGFEIFAAQNETGKEHPYLCGLKEELQAHHGVYIFFDSRGQAIYAGKARKQKLWKEMNLAFNRKREDLQLIRRVRHPSRNVSYATSNERARQIVEVSVSLHELAGYFSAYEVADGMVSMVEAMLVRSFANDLLNKRMERFGPVSKRAKRDYSGAE